MPQRPRLIQMSLGGKIFLCVLAIVYVGYLVVFANFLFSSASTPSITEHLIDANLNAVLKHWTTANMRNAADNYEQDGDASNLTQRNIDISKGKAAQQQGRLPRNGESSYPLSTIGKVFFTTASGRDSVCSGTAIVSSNHSVVDTAGHCLWHDDWVQNVIFCPLYHNGVGPYDCWAAHDLVAPSDWIRSKGNNLHRDFGMAIVSPNSQGDLTDVVGGAGWAYNQRVDQPFYAYGYPAAPPFDGQTMQSCESSSGRTWKFGDGTVVSIPCNMTGGSSGGPWFIEVGGKWYLNGHNDFTSSMQPGHMFSPYYDDTWYTLYNKAQHS